MARHRILEALLPGGDRLTPPHVHYDAEHPVSSLGSTLNSARYSIRVTQLPQRTEQIPIVGTPVSGSPVHSSDVHAPGRPLPSPNRRGKYPPLLLSCSPQPQMMQGDKACIRTAKKTGNDKKSKQAASKIKMLNERMGLEVSKKGGRFKLNRDHAGWHHRMRADMEIPELDPEVTIMFCPWTQSNSDPLDPLIVRRKSAFSIPSAWRFCPASTW